MNKWLKYSKLSLIWLIIAVLSCSPLSVFALDLSIPEAKIIITFKDNIDQNVIKQLKSFNGKIKRQGNNVASVSATIPYNVIPIIESHPSVKNVELDTKIKINSQYQDWGITKTNTPKAWQLGYTGKGVKIAIIDSGIYPHDDLVISGGVSYVPYTSSYADDNGHGTHVAGIIGAKNNSFGTIGTAPDANIFAVKAMDYKGEGYESDILSGIDWAIQNDMDIINLSLGMQIESPSLKEAIDEATNLGIIVVVAAGNDGNSLGTGNTVDYPGQYENAITVGAVNENNQKADFSSAGPSVDIVAPGVGIVSTYLDDYYAEMDGTSMATPYVSGIVALYKEAYPNYNSFQIEQIIKNNAIDLGNVGKDNLYGVGLIQAPKIGSNEIPFVPTAPLHFGASNISPTTASLSWDSVTGATSYELRRNGMIIYSGVNTSFNDSKLVHNTFYTYTVVAKNTIWASPSTSIKIQTKTPILNTPNIIPAVTSTTSAKLAWYKIPYATLYQVKRNGVVVYTGRYAIFTDTKLLPGKSYTYEVIAKNAYGESLPGYRIAYTKTNSVSNIKETHTTNSFHLTWNSVPGATYYEIRTRYSNEFIYRGTSNSLYLSGLLPGYSYHYNVYAGSPGGLSTPVPTKVTTNQAIPVSSYFTTVYKTNRYVSLNWKYIYNASYYTVKRNGVTIYKGNLRYFKDANVSKGKWYTYSITTSNDKGTSASKSVSVKVPY